jgi:glycerol uptake facilitator-like aquaporin
VRRLLRDNSLSVFFGLLFLGALVGQAVAGHASYNQEQVAHGEPAISLGRYLTSSAFGQAVMENWQSEYLQFTLFMLATVWLLQRGSPESKKLDAAGRESAREQKIGPHADQRSPLWARTGGVRTAIYSNSLLIVMAAIFAGAWFAQSLTGWTDYNEMQRAHGDPTVSWGSYLGNAEFWESTLQNWQSEFLAVGSFAVFAVFLRQRGSPESKPVGAPHDSTGVES